MIFESILNSGDVKTIEVKQNVLLTGRSTTHQIDVYWEFERGGIKYFTVVQAKDWANAVNQGELLKFKAVLDDLPNQPRGVFVTRTGYQEGALNYAKANGILLYELREPTEADKQGRLQRIILDFFFLLHHIKEVHLFDDLDWAIEEARRLQLNEIPEIKIQESIEDMILYNQDNVEIASVKSLTEGLFSSGFEELEATKVVHNFSEPTFAKTGIANFPRIKINRVEATISIDKVNQRIEIVAEDFIEFILKNISEGTEQLFNKEGKPL